MNTYELVVVLDGKATSAKKKSVIAKMEKLIKILGGKLKETEDWGVKELAYNIKKSTSGLFLIFTLELDAKAVKSVPAKLKLEKDILRYLLIRKEEVKTK
jgi:small subunit ribosomal protein S6